MFSPTTVVTSFIWKVIRIGSNNIHTNSNLNALSAILYQSRKAPKNVQRTHVSAGLGSFKLAEPEKALNNGKRDKNSSVTIGALPCCWKPCPMRYATLLCYHWSPDLEKKRQKGLQDHQPVTHAHIFTFMAKKGKTLLNMWEEQQNCPCDLSKERERLIRCYGMLASARKKKSQEQAYSMTALVQPSASAEILHNSLAAFPLEKELSIQGIGIYKISDSKQEEQLGTCIVQPICNCLNQKHFFLGLCCRDREGRYVVLYLVGPRRRMIVGVEDVNGI